MNRSRSCPSETRSSRRLTTDGSMTLLVFPVPIPMFLQGQYSLYTSCRPRAFQMQGTENNCSYSIRLNQSLPVPGHCRIGRGERQWQRAGECIEMGKGAGRPRAYYWLDSGPSRDKGGMWKGEDSSFTTARGQENKCMIN